MRIVALLAVRNEELFLQRCLEHLFQQGIETCVIDNGSTDATREIAESFLGRGVTRIVDFPFKGSFDLPSILRLKETLQREIDADWFIHHDADEIREAPRPFSTLREGIEAADRAGYNAINFDEFVFVPTDLNESYEGKDYVEEMSHYYFFEPYPVRRVNGWKKQGIDVDIVNSAGHCVQFEGVRLFPDNFVMRHYICLSRAHAIEKYGSRVFSREAIVERGWSKDRLAFAPQNLRFPEKTRLKCVADGWDCSDPWARHDGLFDFQLVASKVPAPELASLRAEPTEGNSFSRAWRRLTHSLFS